MSFHSRQLSPTFANLRQSSPIFANLRQSSPTFANVARYIRQRLADFRQLSPIFANSRQLLPSTLQAWILTRIRRVVNLIRAVLIRCWVNQKLPIRPQGHRDTQPRVPAKGSRQEFPPRMPTMSSHRGFPPKTPANGVRSVRQNVFTRRSHQGFPPRVPAKGSRQGSPPTHGCGLCPA
jgi:hypothetical protein